MAEKIIKLNSKRANNYLKLLTKVQEGESMTYLLVTEVIGNVVVKNTFNNKVSITPFGGPVMIEDEPINDKYLIDRIDYVDMKYLITLREIQENEAFSDQSETVLS